MSRLVVIASLGLLGCSHHLYSPPSRAFPLESPVVLAPNQQLVSLSGGAHSALFDGEAGFATLGFRRGLERFMEACVDATYARVGGDAETVAGSSQNIYLGRLGLRFHPGGQMHFALTGGFGAGHTVGGYFGTLDAGMIGGYENPYLVPFVGFSGFLSQPLGARTVDVTRPADVPSRFTSRPRFTHGLQSTFGLKLPLGRAAILGGVGHTVLQDDTDSMATVVLGAGVQLMF